MQRKFSSALSAVHPDRRLVRVTKVVNEKMADDDYAADMEYLSNLSGNIPKSNRIYQKLEGKKNIKSVRDFMARIQHRVVNA